MDAPSDSHTRWLSERGEGGKRSVAAATTSVAVRMAQDAVRSIVARSSMRGGGGGKGGSDGGEVGVKAEAEEGAKPGIDGDGNRLNWLLMGGGGGGRNNYIDLDNNEDFAARHAILRGYGASSIGTLPQLAFNHSTQPDPTRPDSTRSSWAQGGC